MHVIEEIEYRRKDGKRYNPFRRKDKWHYRSPVQDAYHEGIDDYMTGSPYRNGYPRGLRHEAYKRGFS